MTDEAESRSKPLPCRNAAAGATRLFALLAVCLAGIAGCGDLTSGGVGDLDVVVAADSVALSTAAGSARPPGVVGESSGAKRQIAPSDLEGTLTLRVQVFVLHPPARWVEVTDGPQEVELALESSEPVILARATVPAGRYRAVRTVFRRVEADVVRGLVVGGVPVTGLVRVRLGAGDILVVDDPTEVEVPVDGEASLLVDLHAARWLRLLNTELRQVAADDFRSQFRLRPRL